VALRLARDKGVISDEHQLLAPTLLRSQVLSLLYRAVRNREMSQKDADRQLDYVRSLRIRLLGDRVLQDVAWKIADKLGWPDTFDAEYVALTQLQADAFITLDADLAHTVTGVVLTAPIEALARPARHRDAHLVASRVRPCVRGAPASHNTLHRPPHHANSDGQPSGCPSHFLEDRMPLNLRHFRSLLNSVLPWFTADQRSGLIWLKATFAAERHLVPDGQPCPDHACCGRLAFALWLRVSGRVSEDVARYGRVDLARLHGQNVVDAQENSQAKTQPPSPAPPHGANSIPPLVVLPRRAAVPDVRPRRGHARL
jgi:predicted nucleic acid-binding protein